MEPSKKAACYEPPHRAMDSLSTLYKIGSGPSSSHTMGPKKAAQLFLEMTKDFPGCNFEVTLYGSLATTGAGHKTDFAILQILGEDSTKIIWEMKKTLPAHPNGFLFSAFSNGKIVRQQVWYSVGGGILEEGEIDDIKFAYENDKKPSKLRQKQTKEEKVCEKPVFDQFHLFVDFVNYGLAHSQYLHHLVYEFENAKAISQSDRYIPQYLRTDYLKGLPCTDPELEPKLIQHHLQNCWKVMKECVEDGLSRSENIVADISKNGEKKVLKYPRLAHKYFQNAQRLRFRGTLGERCALYAYALAVSENNGAATHDVVTAPTCGACGVLPGLLYYYYKHRFPLGTPQECIDQTILDALAVAGVIGIVCRGNASISGAEAGCQAEIGVATAMAAAAGTHLELKIAQLENSDVEYTIGEVYQMYEVAARRALGSMLGLTCDPVEGLVIAPCIQRNGSAAHVAYDTAVMCQLNINEYLISFDEVVAAMFQTGKDMNDRYRETGEGGLAKVYKMDEDGGIQENYSEVDGSNLRCGDL